MKRLMVLSIGLAFALGLSLSPRVVVPSIVRADGLYTFAAGAGVATCDPNDTSNPARFFCIFPYEHFVFVAHQSLDNPLDVGGHVLIRESSGLNDANGPIYFKGPVTCLKGPGTPGMGGTAVITFQVTRTNAAASTQYMTFSVTDSGQDSTVPDQISPAVTAAGPQDCVQFNGQQPVTRGDIVVSMQNPLLCVALQGDWWYTDDNGDMYVWDFSLNAWVLHSDYSDDSD